MTIEEEILSLAKVDKYLSINEVNVDIQIENIGIRKDTFILYPYRLGGYYDRERVSGFISTDFCTFYSQNINTNSFYVNEYLRWEPEEFIGQDKNIKYFITKIPYGVIFVQRREVTIDRGFTETFRSYVIKTKKLGYEESNPWESARSLKEIESDDDEYIN